MIYNLISFIKESTLVLILITMVMYFLIKVVLIDCLANRENSRYFKKLTKKDWKYIDYIWLIIALLGVALGNKETLVRELNQDAAISRTNAILYLNSLKEFSDIHTGSACNDPTGKIDAIEGTFELETHGPSIEYQLACEWIDAVATKARQLNLNQLEEVKLDDFPKAPGTIASYDAESDLEKTLDLYRIQNEKYYEIKEKMKVTPLETFLFEIAPLLICFALALRMVKTTGEIKLE